MGPKMKYIHVIYYLTVSQELSKKSPNCSPFRNERANVRPRGWEEKDR